MEYRPNIVVFVLDSARADFVPSWSGIDTFDPLIKWGERSNSVIFSDAHAHSITSASSMGSLLTGVHPFRHGLRPANSSLSDSMPTVAGRLSNVGYRTIGVSANVHFSSHTGLDRDFDRFHFISSDIRQVINSVGVRDLLKFLFQLQTESAGFDRVMQKHTVTPLLNRLIEREDTLRTDSEAPFFLVTQYIEPHSPYYPPLKYLDKQMRQSAEIAYDIHNRMYSVQANGCDLSPEEWQALKQMYTLEIKYTASKVREAIAFIEEITSRKTAYVITADHGDLFGEQNFLFHSRPLHDKLTHVPLITRGLPVSDDATTNSVYEGPVTHADVVRTFLEVAEADTSDIDGINLRESQRDRFLTQRPYSFDYEILRQHNPDYENPYVHDDPVTAFHIGDYKIKFSRDETSVYNPEMDPSEEDQLDLSDVPDAETRQYEEWRSQCESSGLLTTSSPDAVEADDAARAQLEDLGYLESN